MLGLFVGVEVLSVGWHHGCVRKYEGGRKAMTSGNSKNAVRINTASRDPLTEDVQLRESLEDIQPRKSTRRRKILAVSSGGGHWVQMMRLSSVLLVHDVVFATVNKAYSCDVPGAKVFSVVDATKADPISLDTNL